MNEIWHYNMMKYYLNNYHYHNEASKCEEQYWMLVLLPALSWQPQQARLVFLDTSQK